MPEARARLGMRPEDALLVTVTGVENMSAFVPVEIDVIERIMNSSSVPGSESRHHMSVYYVVPKAS